MHYQAPVSAESRQGELCVNGKIALRNRLLSENTGEIVLFLRQDGSIAEANHAAEQAYGYAREELLSLRIHDLRAPSALAQVEQQMTATAGRSLILETAHLRRDGSAFPVEVRSIGAEIGGEKVLLSVVQDLTQRRRREALELDFAVRQDQEPLLRYMATHDSLTDLLNRRVFMQELDRAGGEACPESRTAVLLVDLDHFLLVNGILGSVGGDRVLIEIAMLLRRAVRPSDPLARVGGAQFGAILTRVTPQTVHVIARRIRSAVDSHTVRAQGGMISLSASVGIGWADGRNTPEQVMAQASADLQQVQHALERPVSINR